MGELRAAAVSGISYSDFVIHHLEECGAPDVLLLNYGVFDTLCFREEIRGNASGFVDLCVLAGDLDCVVLAAVESDVYGILHRSVVVADRGDLLDVADMVHTDDSCGHLSGGSGFRVFDTSRGKLGVLVDRDILYPEAARMLALHDGGTLVHLAKQAGPAQLLMARAAALANGRTVLSSAPGALSRCGPGGSSATKKGGPLLTAAFKTGTDAALLSSRRPDLYRALQVPFDL